MPDSPKCPSCLVKGKVVNTYRISGTQHFKCQDCKEIYKGPFDKEEFLWKDSPETWHKWVRDKKIDIEPIDGKRVLTKEKVSK